MKMSFIKNIQNPVTLKFLPLSALLFPNGARPSIFLDEGD